jgi:hypothetical protein
LSNLQRVLAEPRPRGLQRRGGQVEDGDVGGAVADEPIDEPRRAAADVDDRGAPRRADARERLN